MDSDQYEELCRHFIAEQTALPIASVQSVIISNPTRPGLLEYSHQIDLYWETGNTTAQYLNIADAKWRSTAKVDQGEVLLLQKVREKVAAHKAFMITNVGFTAGAIAAADDHGIALHVLMPLLDTSNLPRADRSAIQIALRDRAAIEGVPIYSLRVEHRGMGFTRDESAPNPSSPHPVSPAHGGYTTRVSQAPCRAISSPSVNRSIGTPGTSTRGGFNQGAGARGGGAIKK
jgi:hypothetical protein